MDKPRDLQSPGGYQTIFDTYHIGTGQNDRAITIDWYSGDGLIYAFLSQGWWLALYTNIPLP